MSSAEGHADPLLVKWASGEPLNSTEAEALLTHAQGCERCGARYAKAVNAARMLEHGTLAEPGTAELELLEARGRRTLGLEAMTPSPVARRRISPAFFIAPLVAVAAALVVFVSVSERAPLTEAKGLPVVETYVKHGGAVAPWTEGTVLVAGDQLRFRVAPAGATRVTVVGFEAGTWKRLEEQRLMSNDIAFLDRSLELDEAGAHEAFSLVFGDARLSDDELSNLATTVPRGMTVVPVVQR